MKKLIIAIGLTMLLITGCSKDELPEPEIKEFWYGALNEKYDITLTIVNSEGDVIDVELTRGKLFSYEGSAPIGTKLEITTNIPNNTELLITFGDEWFNTYGQQKITKVLF